MSAENANLMDAVGTDLERRNSIIKECLRIRAKRDVLNESLAQSVGQDVYDLSLARVLLEPQVMHGGQMPDPVASEHGPVVKVWLREDRDTVVAKNSYRDSVEEEERTTVRRRFFFLPMGDDRTAIDAFTFQVSNVAKFKSLNLNGNAYSLVERARQRMARAMAIDETNVALTCLGWAAQRFGRNVWGGVRRVERELRRLEALGAQPVVLANPADVVDLLSGHAATVTTDFGNPCGPVGALGDASRMFPVYANESLPEGRVMVVPSGRRLGVLAIEHHARVASNDRQEKFLTGWTCAEEVGLVLVNLLLVTTVHTGVRGFLAAALGRLSAGEDRVAGPEEHGL